MRILNFPDLRQVSSFDCGASAVQSVLAYYGFNLREEKIIKICQTNENGTRPEAIEKILKQMGLKYKAHQMDVAELKKYIKKRVPIIICLQAWKNSLKKLDWTKDWSDGHWVVCKGYGKTRIYFEDPSTFNTVYLTYNELENRWHDIDYQGQKYNHFGIAVYGKKAEFSDSHIIHMD